MNKLSFFANNQTNIPRARSTCKIENFFFKIVSKDSLQEWHLKTFVLQYYVRVRCLDLVHLSKNLYMQKNVNLYKSLIEKEMFLSLLIFQSISVVLGSISVKRPKPNYWRLHQDFCIGLHIELHKSHTSE